jgi:parallel beta-helix repeat protein
MLAAAAVLVVGAVSGAAATTWYVDDGGGAGIDFTKIQDAVSNASAGDTIYVYDGMYNEQVVISTSITLSGQSESGVTIDGGGSGNCVRIISSDVVINRFTITNASRYGVYASSSDLSIEHVTITDNGIYGIYFNSGKGFTLRDSTIDGNGGGITSNGYATGDAVVEDNTITNNIGHGMAIALTEGKSATVRNNKIDNNAGSSSDGIRVHIAGSGGLMTIENNTVTKSGRYGVYLRGVRSGSTIANFTVTDSGNVGLYAYSSDVNIENVTITGNDGYGIYFQSGKGFTLRDSTIDGNGGGITYHGYATGDAVVEDNVITNNIGHGMAIALTEGKSATVRNNNIDNNVGSSSDGINVNIADSGGVMAIENNPVTKSGRYGICLTGVRTGSTIANFTVQGSGNVGLYTISSDVDRKRDNHR